MFPADLTLASETEILAKILPISAFVTSKFPSAAARFAVASSILIGNLLSIVNKVSPFLQNRCLYKHFTYISDTLGITCFLNLCIIRPS
jgi:hypothetical protein